MGSTTRPGKPGLTFRRAGRFIHLSGSIDEFAEYAGLLAERPPLRLVMADVQAVNSQGVRKWLNFIRDYGVGPVEFHECPVVFIDAANMIPGLVSETRNSLRIKSILLPFDCLDCKTAVSVLLALHGAAKTAAGQVALPDASCPSCGESMRSQIDPSDHFFFLSYGLP